MTMLPFWAYMAPTIFAEVKPERVEEDAIGLANSSVYGLAVALRTRVVPNALICFVLELNRRLAMNRRKLLKTVTLAAASGAISAPRYRAVRSRLTVAAHDLLPEESRYALRRVRDVQQGRCRPL